MPGKCWFGWTVRGEDKDRIHRSKFRRRKVKLPRLFGSPEFSFFHVSKVTKLAEGPFRAILVGSRLALIA